MSKTPESAGRTTPPLLKKVRQRRWLDANMPSWENDRGKRAHPYEVTNAPGGQAQRLRDLFQRQE